MLSIFHSTFFSLLIELHMSTSLSSLCVSPYLPKQDLCLLASRWETVGKWCTAVLCSRPRDTYRLHYFSVFHQGLFKLSNVGQARKEEQRWCSELEVWWVFMKLFTSWHDFLTSFYVEWNAVWVTLSKQMHLTHKGCKETGENRTQQHAVN